MTNVESMDYTHSYLSGMCQPLRYRALPFLTSRHGANFAGASKPRDMIRSITHKPYYIFLKTATIPTYYGISIAIPRYITMQLSTVSFMTHFIIVILLCMIIQLTQQLWLSYRSSFFIHVTLDHCTSWYTARGIHIESYFVRGIEL